MIIEHVWDRSLTAMVACAGSRGFNQPFRADTVNYVLPTGKDAAGNYTWPTPRGSGTVINPNYRRVDGLTWINDSWYNSLQLQLEKRMSRGLQVQGSYTSLVGPGLANVDLSFFKNHDLKKSSERLNVRRRAETFNVLTATTSLRAAEHVATPRSSIKAARRLPPRASTRARRPRRGRSSSP